MVCVSVKSIKPGFHYQSWRPELTARVDGWPVSINRRHGPCWRARVSTSRVDGPSTRVVETGLYTLWFIISWNKLHNILQRDRLLIFRNCTGWRNKNKTGPPSQCKYSEIPWLNCMEIGELLQYYMLNTVINILFKNFIELWRHLAKTQLLSFIHIVQTDLYITQYLFFARWRHSAMKFLNKKLMTVFSI